MKKGKYPPQDWPVEEAADKMAAFCDKIINW